MDGVMSAKLQRVASACCPYCKYFREEPRGPYAGVCLRENNAIFKDSIKRTCRNFVSPEGVRYDYATHYKYDVIELARLIKSGMSDSEVAKRFGISVRKVKEHRNDLDLPQWEVVKVNLERMIKDIIDQYPDIIEGLVDELIQNAVDAKSKEVHLSYQKDDGLLISEDNGTGITDINRFFTFFESTKNGSVKIGFRGRGKTPYIAVGREVYIETKTKGHHRAWVWKGIRYSSTKPKDLVKHRTGTFIEISAIRPELKKRLSVKRIARYLQLRYGSGPKSILARCKVLVNNTELTPIERSYLYKKPVHFKVKTKGGEELVKGEVCYSLEELPEDEAGVAVNVHGQTVKRDLFGVATDKARRIFGYIDADFLWKSKTSDHRNFRNTSDWLTVRKMMRSEVCWLLSKVTKRIEKFTEEEKRELRRLGKMIDSIIRAMPELNPHIRKAPGLAVSDKVTKREGEERKEKRKKQDKKRKYKTRGRFGIAVSFEDVKDGAESRFFEGAIYINRLHPSYIKCANCEERVALDYHQLKCCVNELIKLNPPEGQNITHRIFELQEKALSVWARGWRYHEKAS